MGACNSSETGWIAGNLPFPEVGLDPDKEGRDNLLECLQGTDQNAIDASTGSVSIEPLAVGGLIANHIVLRLRKGVAAVDLTMTPQISDDLDHWLQGPAKIVLQGHEPIDETHEPIIFRSTNPVGSQPRKFGRLKLEPQP